MSQIIEETPTHKVFYMDTSVGTTRKEAFEGITAVLPQTDDGGRIALWGPGNDDPQRVIEDKKRSALVGGVIERKKKMLISGGIRYGIAKADERTGVETMHPIYENEIADWLEDTNLNLYLNEATNDWYTHYNVFPEIQFNKGRNYVTGIGCQDASHVRLGTMDRKGVSRTAYLCDWRNGTGEKAISIPAIDPYTQPVRQMLEGGKARYIIPIRELNDGRFYYGRAPWHALRTNGWLDVHMRIPELKAHLLKNMMHIRYHFEVDERYWPWKFPTWNDMKPQEKLELMAGEMKAFNDFLQGKGQGGAMMSNMIQAANEKGNQESMIKVHELKMTLADGAYVEDSAEVDFIMVRDMGLAPGLYGISPSKNRASSGSGSEDRVLRTNHLLDAKPDADMILSPLAYASRINGWDKKYGKGQRLVWWMANYYAATLDRTMQVADLNDNQGNIARTEGERNSILNLSRAVQNLSQALNLDKAA